MVWSPSNKINGEQITGTSGTYNVALYGNLKALMIVSEVTGGTVKFQYSITSHDEALAGNIVWYDSSLGDITNEGGLLFTAPIKYLRVLSSDANVTYRLSLRSDR